MSVSGKKTPLLLNSESELNDNRGLWINPIASEMHGVWEANDEIVEDDNGDENPIPWSKSYKQGKMTVDTVLYHVTSALPNLYNLVGSKLTGPIVFRNAIRIGRPIDSRSGNERINIPALGNCRPDTFKTSYAGYGTFVFGKIGDRFYNVKKLELSTNLNLGLTETVYPPKNYPLEGSYSYIFNNWSSLKNGPGAPSESSQMQFTPYTEKYQYYHEYAWVTGWPGAYNWQKKVAPPKKNSTSPDSGASVPQKATNPESDADSYAGAYFPRPDLRPRDKNLIEYDDYFKYGFIGTIARQAYYEFWSDYTARRTNQYPEFVKSFQQHVQFQIDTNKNIASFENNKTFIKGNFSNINDLTTSDWSGVSEAFKIFGTEMIKLGKTLDLSTVDKFGLPSKFLLNLQKYNGLTEALKLALMYVELTMEELNDVLMPTYEPSITQEKKIYDALKLISGQDLTDIQIIMNCSTVGIKTLADLIDPKKMFPESFTTLTVPSYNVNFLSCKIYNFIYDSTSGTVNSKIEDWGGYLKGILPDDLAIACGAFMMTINQVKNIRQQDIEKISQVVANLELTNKDLPLVNSSFGVPGDVEKSKQQLKLISLGSGTAGTYRFSDFMGAMSGWPYRDYYANVIDSLKAVETDNLKNVYKKLHQKSIGNNWALISRGKGYADVGKINDTGIPESYAYTLFAANETVLRNKNYIFLDGSMGVPLTGPAINVSSYKIFPNQQLLAYGNYPNGRPYITFPYDNATSFYTTGQIVTFASPDSVPLTSVPLINTYVVTKVTGNSVFFQSILNCDPLIYRSTTNATVVSETEIQIHGIYPNNAITAVKSNWRARTKIDSNSSKDEYRGIVVDTYFTLYAPPIPSPSPNPSTTPSCIVFNSLYPPSGQPAVYNTYNKRYTAFLNTYGVWESTPTSTFDRTYTFNVTVAGTYEVISSCDNDGYVYIDEVEVLRVPDYRSDFRTTVNLTAGNHTIRTYGTNWKGPASMATMVTLPQSSGCSGYPFSFPQSVVPAPAPSGGGGGGGIDNNQVASVFSVMTTATGNYTVTVDKSSVSKDTTNTVMFSLNVSSSLVHNVYWKIVPVTGIISLDDFSSINYLTGSDKKLTGVAYIGDLEPGEGGNANIGLGVPVTVDLSQSQLGSKVFTIDLYADPNFTQKINPGTQPRVTIYYKETIITPPPQPAPPAPVPPPPGTGFYTIKTDIPVFTNNIASFHSPYPYNGWPGLSADVNKGDLIYIWELEYDGYPGNGILDGTVQNLIDAANLEILKIQNTNATGVEKLNYWWDKLGTQMFIEQRAIPISITKTENVYQSAGKSDISSFVHAIDEYSQNTDYCETAEILDAISDLNTLGGQSNVAGGREARNARRLANAGGELDSDVPDDFKLQTATAEAKVGSGTGIDSLGSLIEEPAGQLLEIKVKSPGFGYDPANPPKVIILPQNGVFGTGRSSQTGTNRNPVRANMFIGKTDPSVTPEGSFSGDPDLVYVNAGDILAGPLYNPDGTPAVNTSLEPIVVTDVTLVTTPDGIQVEITVPEGKLFDPNTKYTFTTPTQQPGQNATAIAVVTPVNPYDTTIPNAGIPSGVFNGIGGTTGGNNTAQQPIGSTPGTNLGVTPIANPSGSSTNDTSGLPKALNGEVTKIIITNPGQGYKVPPIIIIDPPPTPSRVGEALIPGSFAGSPYTDDDPIPRNLISPNNASHTVPEAIDSVTMCNCDCWDEKPAQ
jgi:hypothetical protein